MKNNKNYSIWNLIPFIVGSVIGIGAYFKIGSILQKTGGSAWTTILTWVIAIVIIASSLLIVTELVSEKDNEKKGGGILHIVEKYLGKTISKYVQLYVVYIYFPTMLVTYSSVAASFLIKNILNIDSPLMIIFTSIVILTTFIISNSKSIVFGKFVQTSTVLVKLIPLVLLIIIGLIIKPIFNIHDTHLVESFSHVGSVSWFAGLSAALPAAMFAMDGWQFATSLSTESKGGSKSMVIALISSIIIIGLIYILYTLGGLSIINSIQWASGSTGGAPLSIGEAFAKFFNNPIYVKIITGFIVLSAIGALNGLTIFHNRIIYNASKNGLLHPIFTKVSEKNQISFTSSLLSLCNSYVIMILILGSGFLFPTFYNTTKGANFDMLASVNISSDILTAGMFSFVYILIAAMSFKIKKISDNTPKSLKLSKPVFYISAIIMLLGGFIVLYVNFQENPTLLVIAFVVMILSGLLLPTYKSKQSKAI